MRTLTIALCLLATPALADVTGVASVKCPIKGNINAKGERIYHMPGQQAYDDTRINPTKGEAETFQNAFDRMTATGNGRAVAK